jgi:ketosteroid isomerase-like protein
MARDNVQTVKRAVAALNERDIDAYLGCCTDDVELHVTPMAAVGGVYEGREAIQRFWTDIADTSPDFRVEIERIEPTPNDGVVAFMRVKATGRTSGIVIMDDHPTANVYDFADGRIRLVRIFTDRSEALEAAGLPE